MKVEAIILAGALNNGKLADVSKETYEALIPVEGRPMIEYVIEALGRSATIKGITVVGPVEAMKSSGFGHGIRLVQSDGKMFENLSIGVEHARSTDPVLIVTSDIPLIHPQAIDDFVTRCLAVDADIHYPIITKSVSESQFPGVRRTYVPLKGGVFTGGNIALIRPEVVPACRDTISQAIAMRKNPWKLSRLLGFKFIIKLMFKQLTLAEIERRVESILGFKGVGIETDHPEIGIDIDKPEDFELITNSLRKNAI